MERAALPPQVSPEQLLHSNRLSLVCEIRGLCRRVSTKKSKIMGLASQMNCTVSIYPLHCFNVSPVNNLLSRHLKGLIVIIVLNIC